MATIPRRVAILGGARIPFARANTSYVDQGNLEMMSAAMKALVDRFSLKGQKIGEVSAGAVIKHSRDWNLARESTQSAGLDPQTPAYDVARLRHQPHHRVDARQPHCARRDRLGDRRRLGQRERHPDLLRQESAADRARERERKILSSKNPALA